MKTGGDPPHSKEVKESCWALVTKLLCTILKEVHKVWRFAAEAVSIGSDSLMNNGMFLYAALEELRVLREFLVNDWQNHPKFNQNIVRHLFETCLPWAVYESRKEGSHILKINALTATGERHQARSTALPPAWVNCIRRWAYHRPRRLSLPREHREGTPVLK